MTEPRFNPWLHRFAVLTALATLTLLGVGGLVTSHGVGMAVPDWPNTYGYNMFLFPPSKWVGGIFYEHSHRLVASGVGLLTTILAGWLWFAESRRWLRWLGVIAFFGVVLQGVLGGLRVVLFKDQIGIFHAALAQIFFTLVCALALFTSRWWTDGAGSSVPADRADGVARSAWANLRHLFLFTTILIFLQLILGATMRHQHAGLAIPDFPLAYGKLWPNMSSAAVVQYNQQRLEITAANAITPFQVGLQMVHRLTALVILVYLSAMVWRSRRREEADSRAVVKAPLSYVGGYHCAVLRKLAVFLLTLILVQASLGAWTIWSNKAADVVTAHVLIGALSLVTGVFGCLICFRRPAGNAGPVASTSQVVRPNARFSASVNL